MKFRIEYDSMGEIKVQDAQLWAAQTQRSLENFRIGEELMPQEIIRAVRVPRRPLRGDVLLIGSSSAMFCSFPLTRTAAGSARRSVPAVGVPAPADAGPVVLDRLAVRARGGTRIRTGARARGGTRIRSAVDRKSVV